MIVLGLDPSLTGFGYSVFDSEPKTSVVLAGVWETWPNALLKGKRADDADRFAYLAGELWRLADRVKPDRTYVEGTVFIPGKMTAASIHALGRVRGFVDVVAHALGHVLVELSPAEVKKGLSIITRRGEGLASKGEVLDAVCRLYPEAMALIPNGKVGFNAADAIAVAHVGMERQRFKDRLSPW